MESSTAPYGSTTSRLVSQRIQSHLDLFQQKSTEDQQIMTDLREFIRERAKLEAQYAESLYKLVVSMTKNRRWDLENDFDCNGTLWYRPQTAKAMFELLKATKAEADNHVTLSQALSKPLQEYVTVQLSVTGSRLRRCTNLHSKIKVKIEDVLQRYDEARHVADGLDEQVVQAREKLDKAKEKFRAKKIAGKVANVDDTKFKKENSDIRLSKFRAERSRNVYILNKAGMNSMLEEYYNTYLNNMLSILDDGYYTTTTTVMSHYHDALDRMHADTISGLNSFTKAYNSTNENKEHARFLSMPVFSISDLAIEAKGIFRGAEEMANPLVEFDGSRQYLWRELQNATKLLERFCRQKDRVNKKLVGLSNVGNKIQKQRDFDSVINQWFELKYEYMVLTCDEARLKAWIELIHGVGIKHNSFEEGDDDVRNFIPDVLGSSEDEKVNVNMNSNRMVLTKPTVPVLPANSVSGAFLVIQELISTEITFKEILEKLNDFFYKPLIYAHRTGREFLSVESIEKIFANVNELVYVSTSLIKLLQADETVVGVARTMIDSNESRRVFCTFAENFNWATKLLVDKYSNSAAFAYWLRHQEDAAGGSFESLYITPIQRVPRYVLLLKELKKRCYNDKECPSFMELNDNSLALLDKAITTLEEATKNVNNQVGDAENTAKMANIEDKTANLPRTLKISVPGRLLVKQWESRVILSPETVVRGVLFLFSDLVLITRPINTSDRTEHKKGSSSEYRGGYEYSYRAHFFLNAASATILSAKSKTVQTKWIDNIREKYNKYSWAAVSKGISPLFWFGSKELNVVKEVVEAIDGISKAYPVPISSNEGPQYELSAQSASQSNGSFDSIISQRCSSSDGLKVNSNPTPYPRPQSSLALGVLNLKSSALPTKFIQRNDKSNSESNSPHTSLLWSTGVKDQRRASSVLVPNTITSSPLYDSCHPRSLSLSQGGRKCQSRILSEKPSNIINREARPMSTSSFDLTSHLPSKDYDGNMKRGRNHQIVNPGSSCDMTMNNMYGSDVPSPTERGPRDVAQTIAHFNKYAVASMSCQPNSSSSKDKMNSRINNFSKPVANCDDDDNTNSGENIHSKVRGMSYSKRNISHNVQKTERSFKESPHTLSKPASNTFSGKVVGGSVRNSMIDGKSITTKQYELAQEARAQMATRSLRKSTFHID
eukprot:CFRG7559T1